MRYFTRARNAWQAACSAHSQPRLHCSGLGAVPKDGRWHMILHLSAPAGGSINDCIDKDQYPSYTLLLSPPPTPTPQPGRLPTTALQYPQLHDRQLVEDKTHPPITLTQYDCIYCQRAVPWPILLQNKGMPRR